MSDDRLRPKGPPAGVPTARFFSAVGRARAAGSELWNLRTILALALLVSVAWNVWLLSRSGRKTAAEREADWLIVPPPSAGVSATPRVGKRVADPEAAREIAKLSARIQRLERDLAAAKEKAAELDAMDPMAVLVYSRRPLGWKARKLLEIADERARWAAIGKVAAALSEREDSGRLFLEALRAESDPAVVAMLGSLVRGSLEKTPAEDRRAFAELLRSASLPETRAAAVQALFMSEQFRGGVDERAKALAAEMNGHVVQALGTETSPEVVAAIARNLAAWGASGEAVEALRAAADRLPPSPGRRAVWEAIARGTALGDGGADLLRRFEAATDQDLRNDIAAGIALVGNTSSMGGGSGDPAQQVEDARARFRAVFGGTSDATVRRSLVRASLHGLGCLAPGASGDEAKADAAAFFREVAALETDAKQRARIERIAQAFAEKGEGAYADADRILSSKE